MPLQLHKRAARLAPLLTGALVWTIHWWMVLTNAEHFFRRDLALFALPSKHYWLERVRQGALPEWTPLMSGGMPFLSDPANQTFYPLNLLLLLGDSTWSSLTWFVLGHSALSLAGFYLLARTLRIRPWIAVWGALIYTLSGYTLSITDNLNYLPATAWAPIALALYWRAIHQNMLVFAPLSGLSVGFIALGGDAVSASCLYGVMLVLAVTQKQISFRAHMQCVFIALLAGTLIACVQMVPAYPLIVESIRSAAVQGASAMSWSFPPIRGFELVQPAIIGNVQYLELASSERLYPGKGFPWAESVYVGMIPALVALASIGTRQVQLWLTLFLVAFALSLGSHLPGVPTIWSSLIAFGTQRYPEKLLLFVTLFLCIGAAVAANTQLRNLQCWWDRLSVFYRCS
ncbi:MAG: YfhO family protein, partial [Gammaproteobacteria bacterium]|nr:YfhO family protein [Gammaproteobacteria bacterium]